MKYQNDIDKMNTNRNLFLMSLPIFVELLLQLLVGNVDQMMVSRVSQPSVAAIVNANQIMNLVIIVLSMASTAVTVILSQYLGAQDEKNASRTCMVSIVLIGGVSLAATILVFAGHTPLYRAIHVPEEVFDEASLYLLIVGAFILVQGLYLTFSAMIRAFAMVKVPKTVCRNHYLQKCHEYCGKCDFNQRLVRNAAAWGGRSGDLDGYQ